MDERALQRLEDLEIRYAFQEELLRQLDEVIKAQADQLDALQREVRELREDLGQGGQSPANTLLEEKPPHY